MEHNLQLFEHEEFGEVRVVIIDGEPWFVAADVCRILELDDVSKAVSRLDDDEKGTNLIPTRGGEQSMLIVNEPGLYRLIFSSRKPEAKKFQRWVTHEVLPSIRKTGTYNLPSVTTVEVERQRIDADLKIATMSLEQKKIDEKIENARQLKGIAALTHDSDFREYLLHKAAKYITNEDFVSDKVEFIIAD